MSNEQASGASRDLKLDSQLTPVLIGLSNSLDDWKDAGGDSLVVVRDIARLIQVILTGHSGASPSSDSGASK